MCIRDSIQAAFLCAFVESILSKMPIFMAFIVLAGFADNTLTGKTCLFVGLGLLAVVVVQTVAVSYTHLMVFFGNGYLTMVTGLVGGLLADVILKKADYKSAKSTVLSLSLIHI